MVSLHFVAQGDVSSRCKHSHRGSQVPACPITFCLLLCQLRLCKAVAMQSAVGWFEQPCSLFLPLAEALDGLTVQGSVLVGVGTVKHTNDVVSPLYVT